MIICTPVPKVGSGVTSSVALIEASGTRVQKMAVVSVASPAATPCTKLDASGWGRPVFTVRSATPACASVMQRRKRSRTGMVLAFMMPRL